LSRWRNRETNTAELKRHPARRDPFGSSLAGVSSAACESVSNCAATNDAISLAEAAASAGQRNAV
jgi:hypothetical protein